MYRLYKCEKKNSYAGDNVNNEKFLISTVRSDTDVRMFVCSREILVGVEVDVCEYFYKVGHSFFAKYKR